MVTGGAEGVRTPDLVIANDALSQLSYCPNPRVIWPIGPGLSRNRPPGTCHGLEKVFLGPRHVDAQRVKPGLKVFRQMRHAHQVI